MCIRYSVILAALAVISVSALAKTNADTKPQTTLTAPGMATADGILSYCKRIDARSAAQYATRLDSITQGHSSGEVKDIRESKIYKASLAVINNQLLKVSAPTGLNACMSYLTGK
jgi:hypothetical protein